MQSTPQVQQQMSMIEGRLIWLVTFSASIVGAPGAAGGEMRRLTGNGGSNTSDSSSNDALIVDAKLCLYVFLLCKHINE